MTQVTRDVAQSKDDVKPRWEEEAIVLPLTRWL